MNLSVILKDEAIILFIRFLCAVVITLLNKKPTLTLSHKLQ